jgi:hypothetical protein
VGKLYSLVPQSWVAIMVVDNVPMIPVLEEDTLERYGVAIGPVARLFPADTCVVYLGWDGRRSKVLLPDGTVGYVRDYSLEEVIT